MSPFHNSKIPLCVDLDGTLIREDVTLMLFQRLLRYKPWKIFNLLWGLRRGIAYVKHVLEQFGPLDMNNLTYHQELLDYIRSERAQGRPVILATAADVVVAQQVAEYLKCFDRVIASDANVNRRAGAKAEALVHAFGPEGFVYAGNSPDDLKVWPHACGIILVNAKPWVVKQAQAMNKPTQIFFASLCA